MSRVINPETAGKERNRLARGVVIAMRALLHQTEPDQLTPDLAAFIVLALDGIAETIERTVAPWEKRDYWVKADKFRLEWAWAETLAKELRQATLAQDWPAVALLSVQVGEKLSSVKVSPRHRMGTPWVGAWDRLQEQALSEK